MSKQRFTATIALSLVITLSIWAVGWTNASAQCGSSGGHDGGYGYGGYGYGGGGGGGYGGCSGGGHSGSHDAGYQGNHHDGHQGNRGDGQGGHHDDGHAGDDHGDQDGHDHGGHGGHQTGAHGGRMAVVGPHCFEVVYRPKETRVYLYDADHRPMSVRGVHGQLSMKLRRNDKVYRFPLKHAAPRAGRKDQDYLAAAVDVSRIRDGDMTVTSELADLPNQRQPQAEFTQPFALSKVPVRVASLDKADRPRIEQQKVCVVLESRLGSMGTPVKVLVGDQPIYLCCKGCLGKVEKNPDQYLAKAAELSARN